ncbi:virion structural protein [Pseudomonas phage 201phi2-1]|uniref:Virion structural protein n=1 Tax=Pseudomonas phage 201phi2-1 TaxID=198110 RepID=B3FJ18_BP201|nr:virion structural protein [Pseudomonas phage 201phi2-1]ABY62985.1 virion structural protein [Pseudomonas phage 201phi2-1]
MSLLDLKSLVSTEDFADAHEPLNDGVKDVPNAQTVAASVGTGDVGNDTTTQGPAKVIPEKPDTDDQTKTEHNVVKESAEKTGGTSAPASDKDSGGDANASAEPEKSEETDEAKEPLEHTSEKVAKDELEKTERATTALEAYAPNAKRFDIIGHPKVKAEQISKMVGYIQRRSGVSGEVTVSAESINTAVELGRSRMAKLEREVRILGSQKVSKENLVEEIAVTEEPTEHGAPPLAPEAAAAITELETDPLDVPLLEVEKVQETLDTLQSGAVAIERLTEIVRANPRISKQAAAVLHASLENIDQMCGLKIRATGFESYEATPRAALEATAVDGDSLSSRAAEIGAKIMKVITALYEKLKLYAARYSTGIDKLSDRFTTIARKAPSGIELKSITIRGDRSELFLDGEFVGDYLTPEERKIPELLKQNRKELAKLLVKPLERLLSSGPADERMLNDIEQIKQAIGGTGERSTSIPGGYKVTAKGIDIDVVEDKADRGADEVTVEPMMGHELGRSADDIKRYLALLLGVIDEATSPDEVERLKKAVLTLRKNSKGGDEAVFQKVQSAVVEIINKQLNPVEFMGLVGKLAKAQAARAAYFEQRLAHAATNDQ